MRFLSASTALRRSATEIAPRVSRCCCAQSPSSSIWRRTNSPSWLIEVATPCFLRSSTVFLFSFFRILASLRATVICFSSSLIRARASGSFLPATCLRKRASSDPAFCSWVVMRASFFWLFETSTTLSLMTLRWISISSLSSGFTGGFLGGAGGRRPVSTGNSFSTGAPLAS